MSAIDDSEPVDWYEDGHTITFVLDRDEVRIAEILCPNEGTLSLCNRRRDFCVVQRFLGVYGLECNIGRSMISGAVPIAWTPMYGDSDLDEEWGQIWVTPVDDPDYVAQKEIPSSQA